jgi:hypothetical protein
MRRRKWGCTYSSTVETLPSPIERIFLPHALQSRVGTGTGTGTTSVSIFASRSSAAASRFALVSVSVGFRTGVGGGSLLALRFSLL